MHSFTDEGRRTKKVPCLITGGQHEIDETMAAQDTFYCKRCGAIPKDSIWYDMEGAPDGRHDRGSVPRL
ncbi:hypothetical protein GCM10010182_67790 [Actinomadura cremea]|nr:hypothetical protein GCM10010182_67790 [Actinomadura cremea]